MRVKTEVSMMTMIGPFSTDHEWLYAIGVCLSSGTSDGQASADARRAPQATTQTELDARMPCARGMAKAFAEEVQNRNPKVTSLNQRAWNELRAATGEDNRLTPLQQARAVATLPAPAHRSPQTRSRARCCQLPRLHARIDHRSLQVV